ncbi:dCTP deaminase [Amycolatopsis oliviviridis]|uniref:Deoxycytidine triphosphate deaminase n=1 Tax=Amycolatopsis oliviviridis TaxID=1471590 RepID=A0ABQ3LIY2_9PSEU|nr:2'-deoxycytidine 5'-triphosphate deaminase [Amycolatopsis oliviviridis]GHH09614.1 deoxycytidine triphosphate deaminase [Amycolatopsis oliviviridis]
MTTVQPASSSRVTEIRIGNSRFDRGVLTDREIRKAYKDGDLSVEPFDDSLIRPAAISLRLGEEAFSLVSTGPVDIADRSTYPDLVPKALDEQGRLRVEPGEVVLAPTMERIGLSSLLAGLVDGTSDYARLGVSVVLCGQVSPGFGSATGAVLTLEIVNHLRHAVLLHPGARICNLMLFASAGSEESYDRIPHNYSKDHFVMPSRLAERIESAADFGG